MKDIINTVLLSLVLILTLFYFAPYIAYYAKPYLDQYFKYCEKTYGNLKNTN